VPCKIMSRKQGGPWRAHSGYALHCAENLPERGFSVKKTEIQTDLLAAFSQEIQLSQMSQGSEIQSFSLDFCPAKLCYRTSHARADEDCQRSNIHLDLWANVLLSKVGSRKLQLRWPLRCPACVGGQVPPPPTQAGHPGTCSLNEHNQQYLLLSFEDAATTEAILSLICEAQALGTAPQPSALQPVKASQESPSDDHIRNGIAGVLQSCGSTSPCGLGGLSAGRLAANTTSSAKRPDSKHTPQKSHCHQLKEDKHQPMVPAPLVQLGFAATTGPQMQQDNSAPNSEAKHASVQTERGTPYSLEGLQSILTHPDFGQLLQCTSATLVKSQRTGADAAN